MCEFCTRHGEGRTWYLNARNYSLELLNDLSRKRFIEHFYHEVIGKGNRTLSLLERPVLNRIGIPRPMRSRITAEHKVSHFGQVLPVEEVEKVLSMVHSITRISCGCRWAKEKKESRRCFGLSMGPPEWGESMDWDFFGSPEVAGIETITREEAVQSIREMDREGLVHSIWTFKTPFIGAVCNCDQRYCLAMRSTVGLKTPTMFKAEFIAAVDADLCTGCRACLDSCQFGAVEYDEAGRRCLIDKERCFGCGVCREACPAEAITLSERAKDPVASSLW